MHVADVGMVVWQVAMQLTLVACSDYLCAVWLLLIQQLHCRAPFGPRWQVAALVARLGLAWAGSILATAFWLY